MKMVAISSNHNVCTGLKLVGVECHNVETADELSTLFAVISTADIGVLVVSINLSSAIPLIKYLEANPQILFIAINDNSDDIREFSLEQIDILHQ